MKPRVVLYSAFLTPFRSGAEACAEEVSALLKQDYNITIITARLRKDLPKRDVLNGVPVIRVGIGSRIDKWLYPVLAPLAARKLRPQLLHAVLESFAGLALIKSRMLVPGAKRLLTCQSTNTSFLVGLMHRYAHRVTVISSVLLERAKRFGVDATLIPNGIRLEDIREACTGKTPGRIVFVGRLEKMKGVDVLLRAFADLCRDAKFCVSTNAHLRIVGDGSQRQILERLAADLKIGDRVTFTGKVAPAHVHREMAQAEIFVGLSRSEALGNVFLEAQAAGCAVVATTVGGIPDIVKDGQTGLLVPSDDVAAATDAISRLLVDAVLRETLSSAGISNAQAYDWAGIAAKYAAVYRTLLG